MTNGKLETVCEPIDVLYKYYITFIRDILQRQ